MSRRILSLVIVTLATAPLVAAAQQSTQPVYRQNQSAPPCAMHAMMMGPMMMGPMMGGAMRDTMGGQMRERMGRMPGDTMMMGRMPGDTMMRRMPADSMMVRMNTDSSMMAEMRSQLNLTDAQVQQMRAIHQRACAAAAPHMQLAMQAHDAAMKALASDNLNAYRQQIENAAKHMVEAQVELAKGMIEFHKSLTPAQRQKMEQMMEQMHERMMRGS